jgi:1-acyl-sn-glycerol-3-phosphate acyltransferase
MFELNWQYEPATDLNWPLTDKLAACPREPDMLVYGLRLLTAMTLRIWLSTYHRLNIIGRENLPVSGSYVLVANHASHLDALCILSALKLSILRRAFPAAARDYFFVDLPRIAFSAVFINATPFSRESYLRHSLDICRHLLTQPGNILILFPEGTRSPTGQLGAFRRGIGSLVAGSNVPVIPCALQGAARAWPKGAIFPRPFPVRLMIGAARTYSSLEPCRESAEQIADDLRAAVEGLLCS